MKFGALHDPRSPALAQAQPFTVGAPLLSPINWFADYPATGNTLGNDKLSCCCEAADLVLLEWYRNCFDYPPIPPDELRDLVLLRYEEVAAWNGETPGNDPGSVPQVDAASWQDAGIFAAGWLWRADWVSVPVNEVWRAIREAPLLVTIGIRDDEEPSDWCDDPAEFWDVPGGDRRYAGYHRVVAGAAFDGALICRTYGFDVPVALSRIVAVDLMRFR